MNNNDIDILINQLASELETRTPVVTGNLLRNIRIEKTGETKGVVARIILDTPYAGFVNYGYETHPNSIKLYNDYKFVERSVEQALRLFFAKYGGTIK